MYRVTWKWLKVKYSFEKQHTEIVRICPWKPKTYLLQISSMLGLLEQCRTLGAAKIIHYRGIDYGMQVELTSVGNCHFDKCKVCTEKLCRHYRYCLKYLLVEVVAVTVMIGQGCNQSCHRSWNIQTFRPKKIRFGNFGFLFLTEEFDHDGEYLNFAFE